MYFDPLAIGVSVLVVGAVVAAALAFVSIARRGEATITRRLAHEPVSLQSASLEIQRRSGPLTKLIAAIGRLALPARADELARLQLRLQQGGIRSAHAVPTYLAAKLVLGVGLLGAFLWINAQRVERIEPAFVVAVVAFASGFYLPDAWLSSRTRSRQTSIERGLPDALDLLVTCVEAGLGLDASLQRVADEIRLAWPVLASELQTTFLEVKAGIPRIEAFRRLAARTGVRDLKSLAATLTQTEIFGTSVALALRIQAEGIRVRRMQRAEEKAAYVAVKMTLPLVLCILPSLLAVIVGPAVIRVAENLLPALGGGR